MKVCSLIDQNPEVGESVLPMPQRNNEPSQLQPESPSISSNIRLNASSEDQTNISASHLELPSVNFHNGAVDTKHPLHHGHRSLSDSRAVPDSVSTSLLGPGVKGFTMSPSMFEEALRLRAEQEKTEQERLKLELISRTKSMLQFAVDNNISPESLTICTRNIQSDQTRQSLSQARPYYSNDSTSTNEKTGSVYLKSPYPTASPLQPSRQYENTNNASSVNPMNFRFGGAQSFDQLSSHTIANRRPRSPAKLGAMAVASLANPMTPYRPANRTIPLHQRHYSMPTEITVSDHKLAERHMQRRNQNISNATNSLRSPEGKSAAIRARPLHAQSLHDQSCKVQNSTQDDMTQHQQVIQFHHWISENPGKRSTEKSEQKRNNSISSLSLASATHKRHKSTDVSMDLLRVHSLSDAQQEANPRLTPKH